MNKLYTLGTNMMQSSRGSMRNAAENIVRAGTPGATTHKVDLLPNTISGEVVGTTVTAAQRITDEGLQMQWRSQISAFNREDARQRYLQDLEGALGTPGGKTSLDQELVSLKTHCDRLLTDPQNIIKQGDFIFMAQGFATHVQKISEKIQYLRTQCDQEIQRCVTQINTHLSMISDCNANIARNLAQGFSSATDEDLRDDALRQLSTYLDIKTMTGPNGTLDVRLSDGSVLVYALGGENPLSYTASPSLEANTLYPTGIGDITVASGSNPQFPITGALGSGKIAALRDLRDTDLPNIQDALDGFVVTLRNGFNALHNQGTGWPTATSLTGTHAFSSPSTETFHFDGTLRIALVDNTGPNPGVQDFYDFDLTTLSGGGPWTITQFRDMINGAGLSITAALTPQGTLSLTSTQPGCGVSLVSLSPAAQVLETGQGISDFFGLNDFWVTENHFNGDGVRTGLSSLFKIRPDIVSQPQRLASYTLSKNPLLQIGGVAFGAQGASNISLLRDFFETPLFFPQSGNFQNQTVSPQNFSKLFLEDVVNRTKRSQQLAENQERDCKALETTIHSISDIDEQAQLALFMQTIKSYSYGAAILKEAQDQDRILTDLVRR